MNNTAVFDYMPLPVASYQDTTSSSQIPTSQKQVSSQSRRVIPIDNLFKWQVDIFRELLEMDNLRDDWDGEGSPPPSGLSKEMLVRTLLWQINLEDLPSPFVSPAPGGGIHIEWRNLAREIELDFNSDGTVEFIKFENKILIDEGPLPLPQISQSEIKTLLSWLRPR